MPIRRVEEVFDTHAYINIMHLFEFACVDCVDDCRRGKTEKQAKEPVGDKICVGGGGVKDLASMGGSRKARLNLAAFRSFSDTNASASVHAVT